jgi:hypothetical protein
MASSTCTCSKLPCVCFSRSKAKGKEEQKRERADPDDSSDHESDDEDLYTVLSGHNGGAGSTLAVSSDEDYDPEEEDEPDFIEPPIPRKKEKWRPTRYLPPNPETKDDPQPVFDIHLMFGRSWSFNAAVDFMVDNSLPKEKVEYTKDGLRAVLSGAGRDYGRPFPELEEYGASGDNMDMEVKTVTLTYAQSMIRLLGETKKV